MNQAPPQYHRQQPQDLPQHARERLEEMKRHQFFTSDLSVNEFLLVKEVGFHRLGLVMGSSIYTIALKSLQQAGPGEITPCTQALYQARELAMERMEAEADALGRRHRRHAPRVQHAERWGRTSSSSSPSARRSSTTAPPSVPHHRRQRRATCRARTSGRCSMQATARSASSWTPRLLRRPAPAAAGAERRARPRDPGSVRRARAVDGAHAGRGRGAARRGDSWASSSTTNHTWGPSVLEFSAVGTAVIAIRADHQIPRPTLILPVTD